MIGLLLCVMKVVSCGVVMEVLAVDVNIVLVVMMVVGGGCSTVGGRSSAVRVQGQQPVHVERIGGESPPLLLLGASAPRPHHLHVRVVDLQGRRSN